MGMGRPSIYNAFGDKVKVHIPADHAELQGLLAEAEVVRLSDGENGGKSIGLAIISMR